MALFDSDFLSRLERLRLAVRRRLGTAGEGDRSVPRPGGAPEHLGSRPYVQGDDFRTIDWPLYMRLGQLHVKVRAKDEAARLHLIVDGSPSMRGRKLEFAGRLAAALGIVTTAEGGDVVLWSRGPKTLGRDALMRALEIPASESPASSLRRLRGTPRAFAVVISDFWDDLRGELAAVLGAGGQLSLIRVLAREEVEPPARGMARLVDVETGESVDRWIGEEETAAYRVLLEDDDRGWREWAHARESSYVRCVDDDDLEQAALVWLRSEGVLA